MKKSLLLFVLVLSVAMYFGSPEYSFVRIENLSEQIVGENLLKAIYERAGIEIEIVAMPGERALNEAKTGKMDGETLRIYAVGEKYPSLIRVPTPISSLKTAAFSKKGSDVVINSKEDLNNYKLVIVRGVQHTTNITAGLDKVHVLSSAETLMPFVSAGRAEVALTGKLNGLSLLKQSGIDSVEMNGEALQELLLYHYIYEGHKDLVPVIDAVVKEMKESGELQELREKYEKEYIESLE